MRIRYAAALVALVACTADPVPRPSPTAAGGTTPAVACGPVTPRATSRDGAAHVRVGPVALFAGPPPGIPLHVEDFGATRRIEVLEPGGELVLSGRHCSTGRPLRIWSGGDLPSRPPGRVPEGGETRFAVVGEGVTYFLFDAAGHWELTVTRDGRVAGTAVVEVTSRAGG